MILLRDKNDCIDDDDDVGDDDDDDNDKDDNDYATIHWRSQISRNQQRNHHLIERDNQICGYLDNSSRKAVSCPESSADICVQSSQICCDEILSRT